MSSSFRVADACLRTQPGPARPTQQPRAGLRVPDGSPRGAGAGLPAEEVRLGPGQAGVLGRRLELGSSDRAPRACARDSPPGHRSAGGR